MFPLFSHQLFTPATLVFLTQTNLSATQPQGHLVCEDPDLVVSVDQSQGGVVPSSHKSVWHEALPRSLNGLLQLLEVLTGIGL